MYGNNLHSVAWNGNAVLVARNRANRTNHRVSDLNGGTEVAAYQTEQEQKQTRRRHELKQHQRYGPLYTGALVSMRSTFRVSASVVRRFSVNGDGWIDHGI